jgi:hypothetical protein
VVSQDGRGRGESAFRIACQLTTNTSFSCITTLVAGVKRECSRWPGGKVLRSTTCVQVTAMAGFVMFSHCKLLQAQSRVAAKADHEDQLSNGDVPGAAGLPSCICSAGTWSAQQPCRTPISQSSVQQTTLMQRSPPRSSCAGSMEKQALLSNGQWHLDADGGSPAKRGVAPHRRNSSDA